MQSLLGHRLSLLLGPLEISTASGSLPWLASGRKLQICINKKETTIDSLDPSPLRKAYYYYSVGCVRGNRSAGTRNHEKVGTTWIILTTRDDF